MGVALTINIFNDTEDAFFRVDSALTIAPIFLLILSECADAPLVQTERRFLAATGQADLPSVFPCAIVQHPVTLRYRPRCRHTHVDGRHAVHVRRHRAGLLAKHLFHAPAKVYSAAFQFAFRFNSYVGLAIAGGLHGPQGLAAIGLLMGFMVPLANVASVLMLARHSESHWFKEILLNPLIIATASGIAFSLFGLSLPIVLDTTMKLLSQASLPLGLIAVGSGLRIQGLHGYPSTLWYGVIVKLLCLPAIAWGLATWFALDGVYFLTAVLLAASQRYAKL